MILHVTSRERWEGTEDPIRAQSLETEGFIHCCYPHQLSGVLARFFSDHKDLIVLTLDTTRLTSEVRVEQGIDVDDAFPHVYGGIERAAVTGARAVVG